MKFSPWEITLPHFWLMRPFSIKLNTNINENTFFTIEVCVSQIQEDKRQQKMLSQDDAQNIESILSRDRVVAQKGWKIPLTWWSKRGSFYRFPVMQCLVKIFFREGDGWQAFKGVCCGAFVAFVVRKGKIFVLHLW